jgi:hypothetical protein
VRERGRRGAKSGVESDEQRLQRRLRGLGAPVDPNMVVIDARPEPVIAPEAYAPPVALVQRRPRMHWRIVLGILVIGLTWSAVSQVAAQRTYGWSAEQPAGEVRLEAWPPPRSDVADSHVGSPPTDVSQADTYAFTAQQPGSVDPVTYDPCAPIHVVVNDHKAFDGAAKELDAAFAEVSKATGLVFVNDGSTEERPVERRAYQDDHYGKFWVPVLVALSDTHEYPKLKGDVAGLAGSQRVSRGGFQWFTTGQAVFDGPQLEQLYQGKDGPARVRAVMMHELAHVVGLGHVSSPREVMQPSGSTMTEWGPGDRAGLAQLGNGSCIG